MTFVTNPAPTTPRFSNLPSGAIAWSEEAFDLAPVGTYFWWKTKHPLIWQFSQKLAPSRNASLDSGQSSEYSDTASFDSQEESSVESEPKVLRFDHKDPETKAFLMQTIANAKHKKERNHQQALQESKSLKIKLVQAKKDLSIARLNKAEPQEVTRLEQALDEHQINFLEHQQKVQESQAALDPHVCSTIKKLESSGLPKHPGLLTFSRDLTQEELEILPPETRIIIQGESFVAFDMPVNPTAQDAQSASPGDVSDSASQSSTDNESASDTSSISGGTHTEETNRLLVPYDAWKKMRDDESDATLAFTSMPTEMDLIVHADQETKRKIDALEDHAIEFAEHMVGDDEEDGASGDAESINTQEFKDFEQMKLDVEYLKTQALEAAYPEGLHVTIGDKPYVARRKIVMTTTEIPEPESTEANEQYASFLKNPTPEELSELGEGAIILVDETFFQITQTKVLSFIPIDEFRTKLSEEPKATDNKDPNPSKPPVAPPAEPADSKKPDTQPAPQKENVPPVTPPSKPWYQKAPQRVLAVNLSVVLLATLIQTGMEGYHDVQSKDVASGKTFKEKAKAAFNAMLSLQKHKAHVISAWHIIRPEAVRNGEEQKNLRTRYREAFDQAPVFIGGLSALLVYNGYELATCSHAKALGMQLGLIKKTHA